MGHLPIKGLARSRQGLALGGHPRSPFRMPSSPPEVGTPHLMFRTSLQPSSGCHSCPHHERFQVHVWASAAPTGKPGHRVNTGARVCSPAL